MLCAVTNEWNNLCVIPFFVNFVSIFKIGIMLRFLSFGSGSSGDCYYLESDGESIIIDAGVGIRTLKKYFHDYGINQAKIKSIFVTHDHTDHVAAVPALAAYLHVPVYATPIVHERINTNFRIRNKIPKPLVRVVEKEDSIQVGSFTVCAFNVPHDSADCSGYTVSAGGKNFVIVTDCGRVTDRIVRSVHEADYLVLETNYDREMLQNGRYPHYLKKRIVSSVGHLSNDMAARLLADEKPKRLQQLFLCHLSENNNTPQIVAQVIDEALRSYASEAVFHVLARRKPTGFFELV